MPKKSEMNQAAVIQSRPGRLIILLGATAFLITAPRSGPSQTYQSEPVTVGYRAFNYDGGGVSNEPTQEKPESKLWHHDGYWWGVLWDPVGHAFRIHRFEPATQNWTNTGPVVDDRRRSSADALWDGSKLYIASRAKESHKSSEGPDLAILNRYSYDGVGDSFSLDTGFPVEIPGTQKCRAFVIAKDSNDKLWCTWTANNKVMINRSLGDDLTWGNEFVVPVQGNDVASIDLSSITAFSGTRVGVIWGNQIDKKFYFAVHYDADADTVWAPREDALPDSTLPNVADDHINLSVRSSDGTILAAVKTSMSSGSNPRIFVLKRDPISGNWSRAIFGLVSDDHTRPVTLIDSDTDSVYVFARAKDLDNIVFKSAHVDSLAFPSGYGTVFIDSASDPNVNNPTSTKQNVDTSTGILVLASEKNTKYYLHNYRSLDENNPPIAADDSYISSEDSVLTIPAPGVLANDIHIDGDSLAASLQTGVANGSLALNSDGSFVYTPNTNFNGLDSFSYSATDSSGATDAGMVAITIAAINDPPVAIDDAFNATGNSTLNVAAPGVLSNDSDVDGDSLNSILLTAPAHGQLTLSSDGAFSYTPSQGYAGSDLFSYTATDGGASDTGTVSITIHEPNAPPVAVADAFTVLEDSTLMVMAPGILDNDTDAEGDSLASAVFSPPSNGSLSLQNDGSFTYTATSDYHGFDTFLYIVDDSLGGADTAVVTITIDPVNDAPEAADDAYSAEMDNTLDVVAPGVLVNDVDVDGDALSTQLVTSPANGVVSLNTNGSFAYTPNPGFTGEDSFTYAAKDSLGATSNVATATITVADSPDSTVYTFQPSDDVHVRVSNPNKNYRNRTYLRVENDDFNSYLKFNVSGVFGSVVHAKLRLFVTGASVDGGGVYRVSNDFLGTSTPWDEETLTATNAPQISGNPLGQVGIADINAWVEIDVTAAISGSGVYSLAVSKSTPDRAEFSAKEGVQSAELVIVTQMIGGNAPPVALNDNASTVENAPVAIDVTANDTDSDGAIDPTTVAIVSSPFNGSTAVDGETGIVTYTPYNGFTGSDSFTYTVQDNNGAASDAATVEVTVDSAAVATTYTFQPTDDGQVKIIEPNKNYADKTSTKVQADEFNSYFKFHVDGVVESIQSATLRLYVTNGSGDGGEVYSVSNNFLGTTTPWGEETLTGANAPEISGSPLSSVGQAWLDSFVELDVTAAISSDGFYSFGMSKNTSDRVEYNTREGANPPELIIDTSTQPAKRFVDERNDRDDSTIEATPATLPEQIALSPNYPNPFNAETTIQYALPRSTKVALIIYNAKGQQVRELARGVQTPGYKKLTWNGKDDFGKDVSSGVYFLRLSIGKQNFSRKLILQK